MRKRLACSSARWRSTHSPSRRKSRLAIGFAARVLDEMADTAALDIARADGLVRQALTTSPHSPLAHYAKGTVLRAQRRNEEAILEYEAVIAFDRNSANAYAQLARCKFYAGSIEEMILLAEKAIRLSPRDGQIGNWYFRIGVVHLVQSRIDEAIVWLEKARSAIPATPAFHAHLASAYALRGDTERATAELAEARMLSADGRYSSIAHLKAVGDFGVPSVRALYEATYFAGLRKAGMPEE